MSLPKESAVKLFEALASGVRLDIYRLLVRQGHEGMVAGQIAANLDLPANNVSFHLKGMSHAGLVTVAQEGRFQRYRANLALMQQLLAYLTDECCAGQPQQCPELALPCCPPPVAPIPMPIMEPDIMSDRVYNVLFICSGNSARSIMAEAILNQLGEGRFRAFSAGSHPRGFVHPQTLATLQQHQHDPASARCKSWDEFAGPDAPAMDFVFTVCDAAAGEVCPAWPGQPMTAHWGFADPAAVTGDEATQHKAFVRTYRDITTRLRLFLSLPLHKLDRLALQHAVHDIGRPDTLSSEAQP